MLPMESIPASVTQELFWPHTLSQTGFQMQHICLWLFFPGCFRNSLLDFTPLPVSLL